MPITYTCDRDRQLILTKVDGVLDAAKTTEYFARLQQDPECPDDAIEIVDFTDVTDFTLQYSEMRAITQKYQSTKWTKKILATIFNCTSDLSYEIGRMLQALHQVANEQHIVHIARSEEELAKYIETIRANH